KYTEHSLTVQYTKSDPSILLPLEHVVVPEQGFRDKRRWLLQKGAGPELYVSGYMARRCETIPIDCLITARGFAQKGALHSFQMFSTMHVRDARRKSKPDG
ncbi:hypothetical protein NFI96_004274, partial [Prochilodus magdalenae]